MSKRGSTLKQMNKYTPAKHFCNSEGYGFAHGTFGELLQGVLPNQKHFMVTFPIDLFSTAIFRPNKFSDAVIVSPNSKKKSATLSKMILQHFQIGFGGSLEITSQIPEGKGLASSSADLVATAHAIGNALNFNISADLISQFISRIEPTDGVMYPGASAFYYKEVRLKETIDHLPSLYIVAIDEGKCIDTLEYNRVERNYGKSCCERYQNMLSEISYAIKTNNLKEIGRISTESALMNQVHNYKSSLSSLINVCKAVNGLGIAVAHSGSFLGILLNPQSSRFMSQKKKCLYHIKNLGYSALTFYSLNSDRRQIPYSSLKRNLEIIC